MRELATTLPSPSELDCWNVCQFKWLMEWRNGIRSSAQHTAMLMGRAVSDAMEVAYLGTGDPLERLEERIKGFIERKEAVADEKWLTEAALTRGVVNEYLAGFTREKFGEVVGVQVDLRPPTFPLHVKMDLVTKTESGRVRIVDQKLISGFADIEYENLKYEMGSQPSLYAVMGEQNGWDVEEFVIDYLIKGKAANGRFKETPPRLDTHAFTIEGWKKNLAMISAQEANAGMLMVMGQCVGRDGEIEMECFPRRVGNCIQHWGSRNFPCDFYSACSYNQHPMMCEGLFGVDLRKGR